MEATEKPIKCVWDPNKTLFRILVAKGKTLSNGGFGVILSSADNAGLQTSAHFLFVEEVIYLFERGMIDVIRDQNDTSVPLKAAEIYAFLEPCKLSLSSYLIYAHLRTQSYRVLRHTSSRRRILEEIQSSKDDVTQKRLKSDDGETRKPHLSLKLQLRADAASAPSPVTIRDGDTPSISWDVYKPNAGFVKTNPGLPDIYVTGTFFALQSLSFSSILTLLKEADGIPLRIATVSDSGTVVMFGVTDFGVPVCGSQTK